MKHRLASGLATAAMIAALALPTAFAPTSAAQAKSVTIALGANVNTLDPHMTASVGTDMSVISHLYTPLDIRDPDLKLHPALAKSWKAVDDTTWRFELVSGAKFANGEPLDAEAVKWNFDRVRDPAVKARIASWFTLVKEVKVVSPTTIDIITSSPYPALADQLSMFFMLPPKWTATHKPAQEAMSGGPYALSENVPGDHITMKANPDYWGAKPEFDTVTFRIIPETSARIAALLTGEVDLITGIPTSELKRINASGKATAGAVSSSRSVFIKFNTEGAPLDNKLFRQALNYAVDKDSIAATIFDGKAEVSTCQVLSKDYFGYNPALKPYPYDPAKAKALLKQSGVTVSQPLELDVPTGIYLNASDVAQVVAGQLGEIGVPVKITEMDFSTYMAKYVGSHKLAPASFLTQAWPTLDADGLLTLFAPGNIYAYWQNADFGKLLDQGRATNDAAQRKAIYAKATALMCDEAPAIFLYVQPATYGVSKNVTWEPRGDDWVRAYDMKSK